MEDKCALCKYLVAEITRNGFTPKCKKNKLKFKERLKMDWQNDVDINSKNCDEFKHYQDSDEQNNNLRHKPLSIRKE